MSDVCLILEGTYPYITGGVSTCVHQLIEETPHINYSLIFIGPHKAQAQKLKYPIPPNVRVLKETYLFDHYHHKNYRPKNLGLNKLQIKILENSILFGHNSSVNQLYQTFFDPETRVCNPDQLFTSKEIWDLIEKSYKQQFNAYNSPSFIDYFYTWRFSNYPIFKILSIDIPKASIYHTMSTGYAGLLASIAKEKFHRPLILTEHGIYTHERKIEISQSEWVHTNQHDIEAKKSLSYFKQWWYQKFKGLGEITYQSANVITTLFMGNKEKQIQLGADPKKIKIIPNGINPLKLKRSKNEIIPKDKNNFNIALIGRVVPIKDIKTFIKAIAYVYKFQKNIHVKIIGPTDEDSDYYNECSNLVHLLELENIIEFTGKVDIGKYYPSIDLLILSSISEGQPLVILEAFSFGIPVVATDVGSCKELIYGQDAEDKSLGACGQCVPFGLSDQLGKAIIEILSNKEDYKKMQEIAKTRFNRYYLEKYTINNYLKIYNQYFTFRF